MQEELKSFWETLALLFVVGAIVPIARALASAAPDNWRMVLGRAVLNGILSVSALVVLLWFSPPSLALVGVACALGTLGQSGVEHWARLFIEKRGWIKSRSDDAAQ
ncbi:phage holin family protein [Deefgea piscis]|uniref:phage holin family protein n=1 Tax=Deefgea piscis TaxID=2739061 RepID=UPI001C7F3325|nr:phage holin family protein [Deefgea piscis]QZA80176.1 phage holin family protein [Deefgea piscis]